jgi:Leucine-rich repeat (LRR) protein
MLQYVLLRYNQLTGPAPQTIFNMSKLEIMSLQQNNLYGPIPGNQSFKLPMLRDIRLTMNKFTGPIPLGFAACKNLQILIISSNLFVDVVPTWLGKLSKLINVGLSYNSLSGTIPNELGNLTMLQVLRIKFCNLSGQVPLELGKMIQLTYLDLTSNQLTGPFPGFTGNLSNLFYLDLATNQLTGPVPSTLGNLRSLSYLSIGSNYLESNLDLLATLGSCQQLQKLGISDNPFASWSLNPNHVANLSTNLVEFYAAESQIIGVLPATLSNLSALRVIDFGKNQLIEDIPESLVKLEDLEHLYLYMNSISGPILKNVGMLRRLDSLYLNNNKISGSIPDGIANLTMLQHLDLSYNKLTSNCTSLFHLDSITELYVSHNFLGGALPSHLGYMPTINIMDISDNQFVGYLPNSFSNVLMLTYLNFSHNSLEGSILDSLRSLTNLETLDLSWNNLTGIIPNYLTNFTDLSTLNLSFNNLEGQVPNGGVFSNLTLKSLMGNVRLCGGAPQLGFSPCPEKYKPTFCGHFLKFILPALAISFCAITICLYLLRRKRIKKPDVKASTDVVDMISHRSVSYYEIVRATDTFSEDNLLGVGSYGKVFKGQLDDGMVVAIKVLNMQVEKAMQSFDAECKALRMARHQNLIRILSTCSNLDFRALLLQYMPNGSLEQHLHIESGPYMGFLTRLGIMLDVSMAMEYLHHEHHEVVLHCDLKPSNVLFDEGMTAHVADFGIAKLLLGDNNSMISVSMTGTVGYMAPGRNFSYCLDPLFLWQGICCASLYHTILMLFKNFMIEYAFMGKASRKSDVFSFGIMLLEVFTAKRVDPETVGLSSVSIKAHKRCRRQAIAR